MKQKATIHNGLFGFAGKVDKGFTGYFDATEAMGGRALPVRDLPLKSAIRDSACSKADARIKETSGDIRPLPDVQIETIIRFYLQVQGNVPSFIDRFLPFLRVEYKVDIFERFSLRPSISEHKQRPTKQISSILERLL